MVVTDLALKFQFQAEKRDEKVSTVQILSSRATLKSQNTKTPNSV